MFVSEAADLVEVLVGNLERTGRKWADPYFRLANTSARLNQVASIGGPSVPQSAAIVLMSHVGRNVIKKNSKQRQSRNAIRGENPDTAAFAVRCRRLRTACIC